MKIHFDFEWIDVPRWPDVRSRRSMAMLRIEVNGYVVTNSIDHSDGNQRDRNVIPMFSIAEWLVCNWWHIFYEADKGEQSPDFASRHDLAFAGDDFEFPHLTLKPMFELIQLNWCQYQSPHTGAVIERTEYVRREDLEEQARNIIEAVLDRLREYDVDVEHLEGEWRAINDLDPEELEFCSSAALLGADPFDMDDALGDEISAFWEATEPSLRKEALAAAEAGGLTRVRTWLAKNLKKLGDADGGDWPELRTKLPKIDNPLKWARGCEFARAVRSELGIIGSRFNFDTEGRLAIHPRTAKRPTARVEGLVAAESPACIVVSRRESGKRFLVARALGDFMCRSESGAGLLSSMETDRQVLSRAFAAEFLAPSSDLRSRLSGTRVVSEETLDDLGNEFGVSSVLISHQIKNHGLATVALW